jgi:hypothetical protein
MKELNNKTLTLEEKKWEIEKGYLERIYQLKTDKKAMRRKLLGKIPTSKLLIAFLFANCTAIEIFTGWTTIQSFKLASEMMISPDLTPLVALIGAVVGEVIGYAVYSAKATKENTAGGIVYDQAMHSNHDNSVG